MLWLHTTVGVSPLAVRNAASELYNMHLTVCFAAYYYIYVGSEIFNNCAVKHYKIRLRNIARPRTKFMRMRLCKTNVHYLSTYIRR